MNRYKELGPVNTKPHVKVYFLESNERVFHTSQQWGFAKATDIFIYLPIYDFEGGPRELWVSNDSYNFLWWALHNNTSDGKIISIFSFFYG